jgi:hypothetical protein
MYLTVIWVSRDAEHETKVDAHDRETHNHGVASD